MAIHLYIKMSILADHQYTLLDYDNIQNEMTIDELDISVISIINQIATRVGAPNYQKTPIFKKKDKRYTKKNEITGTVNKQEVEFKQTKLEKNEHGIEAEMDKLRCLLNKITKKHFDDINKKIINNIRFIVKYESDDIEGTLLRMGNCIFEIGSSNKFLSELYSQLYKNLIDEFTFMVNICEKNFNEHIKLFNTIDVVVDETDYDKFCEYNKKKEKRRSMSYFLVNLMNSVVIAPHCILNLLVNLIDKVRVILCDGTKKFELEELVEIISIFLINGYEKLQNLDEYVNLYNFIEELSEYNCKDYAGLSNKVLFKCVDIMEEIED